MNALRRKKAKGVLESTDSPETQETKETENQANIIATESDDPIARAVAKRAAQQAEDAANPENKLVRAVESAEQRVSKSQHALLMPKRIMMKTSPFLNKRQKKLKPNLPQPNKP